MQRLQNGSLGCSLGLFQAHWGIVGAPMFLLVIAAILFQCCNETRVNSRVPKSEKAQNANKIWFWPPNTSSHSLPFSLPHTQAVPLLCGEPLREHSGQAERGGNAPLCASAPALSFCWLQSHMLSKSKQKGIFLSSCTFSHMSSMCMCSNAEGQYLQV